MIRHFLFVFAILFSSCGGMAAINPECSTACNQKANRGEVDLKNCVDFCGKWNDTCGPACADKATSGTDLGNCLNYCDKWKDPCGPACAKKAKDGTILGGCLYDCQKTGFK